jgi:putative DNA primase/helicase
MDIKTTETKPPTPHEQVAARVKEESEALPVEAPIYGKIMSRFILDCLNANELGDGTLFAAVCRGKFIYSAAGGEWFRWTGHVWERDLKEEVLAAAEDVVDIFLVEAEEISKQIAWSVKSKDESRTEALENKRELIFKRIHKLRSDRGRNSMIKFARTCRDPLAIDGDELDQNPWLLGCCNGVLDLRTTKFRDGRPDDFISKSSPTEWRGFDAPAPTWAKWLLEIFDGDEELVSFLRRVLGYSITGLNREHFLLVLAGQGRNGKGTLVETLKFVLGPLAAPIPAEMLLDQGHVRSSAGPSPDIMALRGLRLAFASETDKDRRFSPSRIKWLSGGDTLTGRYPHDKRPIDFEPTHTLLLLTNHKPQADGSDFAFWERLYLVPFRRSYVDREPIKSNEYRADKAIREDLKAEAPGILAWLVRGCVEYQELGLKPPKVVTEATAQYRRNEEDDFSSFLEEYCRVGDSLQESASRLYENYSRWYELNVSKKGIKQAKFGRLVRQRFQRDRETGGRICYRGLELFKEVEIE